MNTKQKAERSKQQWELGFQLSAFPRLVSVFSFLLTAFALNSALGQGFEFGNYQVVSSTRVGRTEFEYVMRVSLTNKVAPAQGITAQVFSRSADTVIVEGDVSFGDVAFGGSASGADTFTMRQNRLVAFNPTNLQWFVTAQAMALAVTVNTPVNGFLTNGATVVVTGTVGPAVEGVRVGGALAILTGTNFTAILTLEEGRNTISVLATNTYGGVGLVNVTVNRDTTAPILSIDTPSAGAISASRQVTVTGQINDIVPGTVNPEQASVMVNGLPATIVNRSYAINDLLLAPGRNIITAVGRDRAGNESQRQIEITLEDPASQKRLIALAGDRQTGMIGTVLPEALVVELVDGNGVVQTNQPVSFTISRNDGTLIVAPDSGRTMTVLTGEKGQAGVQFQLGTRSGVGNNEVSVTSPGVAVPLLLSANGTGAPPARVAALIPETQVGQVGRPLPLQWTAFVTDAGGNPVAGAPITFSVTQGGGSIAGATTVVTNTDSDGRAVVIHTLGPAPGVNTNVVTATVAGVTNSAAVFTATGQAAGPANQTRLIGVVLDNANRPMSNILCRIENTLLVTATDLQGQFILSNAPVGSVRLNVDGRNRGYPGEWHTLQFDLVTVAGRDNQVDRPIYMLPLDVANSAIAGGGQDVTLHLAGVPGSSLTILAHSLRDPNNQPITNTVMWTQVNLERVPMAPPIGSQFTLAWTVQPINLRFNPPARVCVPNKGFAPGQVLEMFGFDHDINAFVSLGQGTVSKDGSQICSNPGFGITKSGWGGAVPPPPPKDCVGTPPPCKKCDKTTGTWVTDPGKNGSDCDSDGDGVADGICQNGVCRPVTEYDPGNALTDDSASGGTSIPWDKNGLLVSAGEKMIWNLEGVDKDRKRRKGTPAWTEINGTGPYEIKVTISGQADWDSQSSGTTVKTFNSLTTGNIILWTRTNWGGATITVTAVYKDNATPPAAPDTGTTKDADYSVTWTLEKRTNCPTTQVTVSPGEAWCPQVTGVFGPAPMCYTYEMGPDINAAGHPDYQNQTILESFFAVTAYNFTMADVLDNFKTNNPTINTADKVAVFLWTGSNNGTFVINALDRIFDQHGGFGANPTPYFTAAKLAAGLGYALPQAYTCGPTVTGNYTITREWKSGNVQIKKDGP